MITDTEQNLDLDSLVETHGRRLYATALRILKNENDAQDAVQDAFVRVIRYSDSFEGRSSIYTWLYRIVVNSALKILKKRPRAPSASLDRLQPQFDDRGCRLEQGPSRTHDTEAQVLSDDLRRSVRHAIQRLPDAYRVVVLLRDIDERSTKEVAELLGITTGAVKVRLHRARAALKTKLQFLGVDGPHLAAKSSVS